MATKRALNSAGFTHASGWVRGEDGPKVQALIDEAKPDVDRVVNEVKHEGESEK